MVAKLVDMYVPSRVNGYLVPTYRKRMHGTRALELNLNKLAQLLQAVGLLLGTAAGNAKYLYTIFTNSL